MYRETPALDSRTAARSRGKQERVYDRINWPPPRKHTVYIRRGARCNPRHAGGNNVSYSVNGERREQNKGTKGGKVERPEA
jgi:hypothetical protein